MRKEIKEAGAPMSAVRRYFVKRHHAMEKLYGNVCDCEPQCLEVVEAAAYEALIADTKNMLDTATRGLREQLATVQGERERLREALKPFAERWQYFERTKHPSGEWPEDLEYADDEPSAIYLGQLKAAKAALRRAKAEGLKEAEQYALTCLKELQDKICDIELGKYTLVGSQTKEGVAEWVHAKTLQAGRMAKWITARIAEVEADARAAQIEEGE